MYCPYCGGCLKKIEENYQPIPGGHYHDIYYECSECEVKFISMYDSFDQESQLKEVDADDWERMIKKIREAREAASS